MKEQESIINRFQQLQAVKSSKRRKIISVLITKENKLGGKYYEIKTTMLLEA